MQMGPIYCGSGIGEIARTSSVKVIAVVDFGTSVLAFGTGECVLLIALMKQQWGIDINVS